MAAVPRGPAIATSRPGDRGGASCPAGDGRCAPRGSLPRSSGENRRAADLPDRVRPVPRGGTVRRRAGGPHAPPRPRARPSRARRVALRRAGLRPRPAGHRAVGGSLRRQRRRARARRVDPRRVDARAPRLSPPDDGAGARHGGPVRRHPQQQPPPPPDRDGRGHRGPGADHAAHTAAALARVGDAAGSGDVPLRLGQRGHPARVGSGPGLPGDSQRSRHRHLAAGPRRRRCRVVGADRAREGAPPRHRRRAGGRARPAPGRTGARPRVLRTPRRRRVSARASSTSGTSTSVGSPASSAWRRSRW